MKKPICAFFAYTFLFLYGKHLHAQPDNVTHQNKTIKNLHVTAFTAGESLSDNALCQYIGELATLKKYTEVLTLYESRQAWAEKNHQPLPACLRYHTAISLIQTHAYDRALMLLEGLKTAEPPLRAWALWAYLKLVWQMAADTTQSRIITSVLTALNFTQTAYLPVSGNLGLNFADSEDQRILFFALQTQAAQMRILKDPKHSKENLLEFPEKGQFLSLMEQGIQNPRLYAETLLTLHERGVAFEPAVLMQAKRVLFEQFIDSSWAPKTVDFLVQQQDKIKAILNRLETLSKKHYNQDTLALVGKLDELLKEILEPQTFVLCAKYFYQGLAHRKLRHYQEALSSFELAKGACVENPESDTLLKRSHYWLIQMLMIKQSSLLENEVHAFVKKYPQDNLTDDVWMLLARFYEQQSQTDKAKDVYQQLMSLPTSSDACVESHFRPAYQLFLAQDYKQASARFLSMSESLCVIAQGQVAQALYWAARSLEEQQDKKEQARTYYWQVICRDPMSYYADMAQTQLQQEDNALVLDFESRQKLLCSEINPIENSNVKNSLSDNKNLSVFKNRDDVQRAQALIDIGLYIEAQAELKKIDMSALNEEDKTTYAHLFFLAKDYYTSHVLFRKQFKYLLGPVPQDYNQTAWQTAYPKPYQIFIEDTETEFKIPKHLLLSLIREESAFKMQAASWANAYGLTQMVMGTARMVAKQMKLKQHVNASDLMREPQLSIRMGGFFFASLLKKFNGNVKLALASYNAGPGAVSRWLKNKGQEKPLDEFIEEIPLEETRAYVKRILNTWRVYQHLDKQ